MLAQVYAKHQKKVQWDRALAQPKLNGHRCLAECDKGKIKLWTRTGKLITTLPQIVEILKDVLADGDKLDGEIYLHNVPLNNLSSWIKKEHPESQTLEYHVYDFPDSHLAFADRYARLVSVFDACEHIGQFVFRVTPSPIANHEGLMEYQAACLDAGYEGAMLRWGRAGYEAGKRSDSLLKVKSWLDSEFKVVGYREGRGTHAGMAIFKCVTDKGHDFEVNAPGTHEEKRRYLASGEDCVGRLLTVRYQEMTKTEAPVPFHPVAIGFREEE